MSNKTYDALRKLQELVLPGLGTLYFALGQIWGWPYGEEIVGSIAAVTAFLGVIVRLAKIRYDGELRP